MVIHLLHLSALPAALSASVLAYSFCSPATTADSYAVLTLGSHGPATSWPLLACLLGVSLQFPHVLSNDFSLLVSPV